MYTVMVTGGLGSGKSTLTALLCEHGAASLDLDEVNRSLLVSNDMLKADLAARFGEDVLDGQGDVNRPALAQRAFASEQDVQDLNAISFPYITEAVSDILLDVHCTPYADCPVIVVEVPLLTQTPDLAQLADEIIAVCAPSDLRLRRAIARGMDSQDAARRISVQPTDAQRCAIADTVCDNAGSEQDLCAWADAWWDAHGRVFEEDKGR